MRAPQGRRISSVRQYRDRLSGGNYVPAGLIDEARFYKIGVVSTSRTKILTADQRIEKIAELTGTIRVTGPKPRAHGLRPQAYSPTVTTFLMLLCASSTSWPSFLLR